MHNSNNEMFDADIQNEEREKPTEPYIHAQEVEDMALSLINAYHPHLFDAKIAYLFRNGSWKNKGQVVTGKAMIAPQLWQYISEFELVVIVNLAIWANLELKGKNALLDHELTRFEVPTRDKRGKQKWSLREQDLKEFSQVIQRHGICIGDSKKLMDVAGKMNVKALQEITKSQHAECLISEADNVVGDETDDGIIDDDAGLRAGEVIIQNIFEDEPFSDA